MTIGESLGSQFKTVFRIPFLLCYIISCAVGDNVLTNSLYPWQQRPLSFNNVTAMTSQRDSGPWGPWTESSQCSRSCGGGIAYQDRICLDTKADGQHSCVGSERKYFSCNIEDCPQLSRDFREEQCARFNSVPYKGKHYSWVPFHNAQNPCELTCMPRGGSFYARLDRRVIDGTRCRNDGSLDVCVDAQCMPVGCDKILGSTTREDECRVCGGDGSTCRIVEGIFDEDNFEVGYNDILLIPVGATSILIKEVLPTNNYLAIRNSNGTFLLNGNWRIEFPREMEIAGTLFHYERKQRGFQQPEVIRAKGPTLQPLFIVLLYQEKNLGIRYEYSIPVTTKTPTLDSYSWTFGDFEECTQTCGGGLQFRPVRCIRNSDRDIVDEGLCDPIQKPPVNASCNTEPCPSGWKIGDWNPCSTTCGGGNQFRMVFCHHLKEGGTVVMSDEVCVEPKPLFMRACNVDIECPDWAVGEWSECNRMCGSGNRTRSVECLSKGIEEAHNESVCDTDNKPPSSIECNLGPCEGVEWIVTEWSGCEGTCSPHLESREVHCANEDGVVFPEDACEASKLPELSRHCPPSNMCEPMWHTSEWTECSVKCGHGVQSRVVFCGVWQDESVIKIDEEKCNVNKKFSYVQNCSSDSCAGIWFTGPWNRCSVPCGGGERTRKILCFHEDQVVVSTQCESTEEPFSTETCNMHACDSDEIMSFGGCKESQHGCCPDGVTIAGPNDEGCPKMNLDTANTTCDSAEYGCCEDNFTLALGPFKKGCPLSIICNDTQFGCCPDQSKPDSDGCNTTLPLNCTGLNTEECLNHTDCENSTYGCCPDSSVSATGPNNEGCESVPSPFSDVGSSGEDCYSLEFGCCPDGLTSAIGENQEGCENRSNGTECRASAFGCCLDGETFAKGPSKSGCLDEEYGSGSGDLPTTCEMSSFGCCPDNITFAKGFEQEGCLPEDCWSSEYGCCSDNVTSASGPKLSGCFPEDCSNSTFGCCPDNVTVATGPDFVGCYPEDCLNSTFGCCPDNVTSASGPEFAGCYLEDCSNSTFGCCPDNTTHALGPFFMGCDNETDCVNSTFGCCEDNETIALGPDIEGCDLETTTKEHSILTTTITPPECLNTTYGCCPDENTTALGRNLEGCCFGMRFGCCPDNKTAALGPTFLGCGCQTFPYGCCPDDLTPAQGFHYHGCKCEHFRFGCCQDNITTATGPHFAGCVCQLMEYGCCPDGRTPRINENGDGCKCENTPYGCCPDGQTAATSSDLSGCPCDTLPYGCCPDGRTPAKTTDPEECPCDAQKFGCCLDGRTTAKGFNYEGCRCDSTRFGCCSDGFSTAQGPDYYGCPCNTMPYGCCADGYTAAKGTRYQGCPEVLSPKSHVSTEVCNEPKESGPCRNFTVMWYFDVSYGSCSRFWYGGCDGNGNKFVTVEECDNVCVKPVGPAACFLPKTVGSCNEKIPSWYYDAGSKQCEEFTYGGCLGNNNRFVTKEECEQNCISLQPLGPVDVCSMPKDEGSCDNPVIKWYYNKEHSRCEQFYYGGCKGNANKYDSRRECEQSCLASVIHEGDICRLSKEVGGCSDFRERWYYDYEMGQCHRFMFSGCDGNDNNFASFSDCEQLCESRDPTSEGPHEAAFRTEYCFLTQDPGPCNLAEVNWFYDSRDGVCKEFYYGGCKGNQNKFKTRKDCESSCSQSQDVCTLPMVKGPCSGAFAQFYYDQDQEDCIEFSFTGCHGNANRFNSRENCYQRCKKEKLTTPASVRFYDVCALPQEPGPCLGYYRMWYYDNSDNNCKSFVYGGCEGNANRFEKRSECETQCVKKTIKVPAPPKEVPQSPTTTNEDVCRLPVESGPCNEDHPRWFYDAQTQSCLPFVFGGCGGNKNRFKTSDICLRFCSGIKAIASSGQSIDETGEKPIQTTTTTIPVPEEPSQCQPSNCAEIQCPYGIEETVDLSGCSTCRCSNPCEVHVCPEGSRCAIDVVRTSREGIRTEPVCRRIEKPGGCPAPNRFNAPNSADCETRCRDDADCRGEFKCCQNGCARTCVAPSGQQLIPPATQPEPASILPGVNVTESKVGEPAELPCNAIGWPRPTVTWWRETTMLPLSSQRYQQLPDYALLIRSVVYEDFGDYSCHAHNGIGSGAVYKVTLVIDLQQHAGVLSIGDKATTAALPHPLPPIDHAPLETRTSLMTMDPRVGSPLQIDCSVHGPSSGVRITWNHRGEFLTENDRKRILSNHTLLITKASMDDSGEYQCVAEYGGSVSSSSILVTVNAAPEETSCVDNPSFASHCKVIIENKYCNNKFYGNYCCASCLKAGQITK